MYKRVLDLHDTHLLNFTPVSNDTGIPARTVREHYQMLEVDDADREPTPDC